MGKRPNVNPRHPDFSLNIHIGRDNVCHLSIDSTGAPLYQRGYRVETAEAPLNEVLAAGLILLSGWRKDCDFIDPMCGSGTLPIEAAHIAYNIPANIHRKTYLFQKSKKYDALLWQKVREDAIARQVDFQYNIKGFDKDFIVVRRANENVKSANLEGKVIIERQQFERADTHNNQRGLLLINPPYDQRLGVEDIDAFYAMIGDQFKNKFQGWHAWIISSNIEAMKHIGLKTSKRIPLFNGALDCRFQKYEIYAGTKKSSKKSLHNSI